MTDESRLHESRLQEALDLLDHGEHWGKGVSRQFDVDDGRVRWCAVGAIEAAWGMWNARRTYGSIIPASIRYGMLADAERLRNAMRGERFFPTTIPAFNDADGTTWEDVALAFKKAIAEETA